VPDQRTALKIVVQAIDGGSATKLSGDLIVVGCLSESCCNEREEESEDETPDQQAALKIAVRATGKRKESSTRSPSDTVARQPILSH
jgi:hypothetical protein